jgi:hypothetical protein
LVPTVDAPLQARLTEMMDRRLALVTRSIVCLESQVRLLSEHRQALITAAVTGEQPIPGVAA